MTPKPHPPSTGRPRRPTLWLRRFATVGRSLRRDDRGVSEVLGAILMFGLLVSLLVLVQVNAVPAQNQQVEFEHSQRVQQDMLALDGALLRAGTENVPASTQIELAARYPSRFFLVNPGVGAGSIETLAPGTVTVSNARAPSASAYWDGTDRTFDTRVLRYRPNYNEYRNAPTTVYEHNALTNAFQSGATVPVDSGSFIEGDQVMLLLVDGQLSTASTRAVGVETTPLSSPARPLTVTNDTASGITLTLPTTLSAGDWEAILADERVANGGHVSGIAVSDGTPYNTLTVTLEPGRYRFRMARVGVGSDVDDTVLGPHYVTPVEEGASESIRADESARVSVRIRDRYNNPAAGRVTFTATGGEFRLSNGTRVASLTKPSNGTGTVSAVFSPDSGFEGTAVVTAQRDFDESGTVEARERTTFSVPVTDGTDEDTDEDVSGLNPWFSESIRLESVQNAGPNRVSVVLYNNGSVDRKMNRVRLLFYSANSGQPADWGKLNGDDADQFFRFGNWEPVDQSVVVRSKQPETITLEFDDAGNKDFFGLAVEYNGTSANYFVQIP
ncbi:Ig-like domain-containing protein [Haloarcula marina]|uniref:Ig-like domain-containing protein n=1 Tax=Haloarcula marina TaxID=2961574 RepID=UPI0020B6E8E8|nr:Ig-like domain-containing protein [Halomicroarcula marina]